MPSLQKQQISYRQSEYNEPSLSNRQAKQWNISDVSYPDLEEHRNNKLLHIDNSFSAQCRFTDSFYALSAQSDKKCLMFCLICIYREPNKKIRGRWQWAKERGTSDKCVYKGNQNMKQWSIDPILSLWSAASPSCRLINWTKQPRQLCKLQRVHWIWIDSHDIHKSTTTTTTNTQKTQTTIRAASAAIQ